MQTLETLDQKRERYAAMLTDYSMAQLVDALTFHAALGALCKPLSQESIDQQDQVRMVRDEILSRS